MKLAGLNEEQARRQFVPSGINLLSVVKHLVYVERWWFQAVMAGGDPPFPWTESDPDADWHLKPADTVESIAALYRQECERSDEIAERFSLDAPAKSTFVRPERHQSLRWILIHMIEETARHNGHADIFRELTDGATGE